MPSSLSALVKLCHCYILLPSRTERDTLTMVHPLLRPTNQGEMTRKLDFAQGHSTSSTRVLGHKGCVNEAATSPLLASLAIVYPMLPSPVIIQTSGDREWAIVADVVETLWHPLHIFDAMTSSPSVPFLENQDDATLTSCRGTLDWMEREIAPKLVYLKGETPIMGLRAMGSDTWELLVAWSHRRDIYMAQ